MAQLVQWLLKMCIRDSAYIILASADGVEYYSETDADGAFSVVPVITSAPLSGLLT